jgi:hypothetical protein
MNPQSSRPLILLVFGCLSGCADVQTRSDIVGARTGTPLTASVGDTVLRVSREKNLPNIVGKSDIFGRTTQSS